MSCTACKAPWSRKDGLCAACSKMQEDLSTRAKAAAVKIAIDLVASQAHCRPEEIDPTSIELSDPLMAMLELAWLQGHRAGCAEPVSGPWRQ